MQGLHQVAKKQMITGFPSLSISFVSKLAPFKVFTCTDGNGNFLFDQSSCDQANKQNMLTTSVKTILFMILSVLIMLICKDSIFLIENGELKIENYFCEM
jgi:hypothetical protein